MTQTTVSTRTRRPGRIAKAAIVFSIVVGTMFGGATAALAETDTLSGECITVHSYRRGCATDLRVSWGSGMSWSAAGTASNTYRWDGWSVVIEAKLNRKWSSNTGWMQVSKAWDSYYYANFDYISGYDPTYGAWVRLCAVANSGAKYCNASRYVADNS